MLLVLVQRGDIFHAVQLAVHAHAHEALGLQFLEAVEVRSLLEFHQRGHDDDFRAFGQGEDVGDDFIGGARLDGASALWAIHLAEAGEEDAQEVVDFGNGADRGTRVAARGLLFQRDGGGKALDLVDVRLVHLREELACVGGKGFHIPALAFRIDDVERECGFARSRRAADDHKFVAGDVEREVVLARTLDMDGGMTHEVPWKVCPDWGVLRVNRHFRRACRGRGRLTVLSHMVVVFQRRFRM